MAQVIGDNRTQSKRRNNQPHIITQFLPHVFLFVLSPFIWTRAWCVPPPATIYRIVQGRSPRSCWPIHIVTLSASSPLEFPFILSLQIPLFLFFCVSPLVLLLHRHITFVCLISNIIANYMPDERRSVCVSLVSLYSSTQRIQNSRESTTVGTLRHRAVTNWYQGESQL